MASILFKSRKIEDRVPISLYTRQTAAAAAVGHQYSLSLHASQGSKNKVPSKHEVECCEAEYNNSAKTHETGSLVERTDEERRTAEAVDEIIALTGCALNFVESEVNPKLGSFVAGNTSVVLPAKPNSSSFRERDAVAVPELQKCTCVDCEPYPSFPIFLDHQYSSMVNSNNGHHQHHSLPCSSCAMNISASCQHHNLWSFLPAMLTPFHFPCMCYNELHNSFLPMTEAETATEHSVQDQRRVGQQQSSCSPPAMCLQNQDHQSPPPHYPTSKSSLTPPTPNPSRDYFLFNECSHGHNRLTPFSQECTTSALVKPHLGSGEDAMISDYDYYGLPTTVPPLEKVTAAMGECHCPFFQMDFRRNSHYLRPTFRSPQVWKSSCWWCMRLWDIYCSLQVFCNAGPPSSMLLHFYDSLPYISHLYSQHDRTLGMPYTTQSCSHTGSPLVFQDINYYCSNTTTFNDAQKECHCDVCQAQKQCSLAEVAGVVGKQQQNQVQSLTDRQSSPKEEEINLKTDLTSTSARQPLKNKRIGLSHHDSQQIATSFSDEEDDDPEYLTSSSQRKRGKWVPSSIHRRPPRRCELTDDGNFSAEHQPAPVSVSLVETSMYRRSAQSRKICGTTIRNVQVEDGVASQVHGMVNLSKYKLLTRRSHPEASNSDGKVHHTEEQLDGPSSRIIVVNEDGPESSAPCLPKEIGKGDERSSYQSPSPNNTEHRVNSSNSSSDGNRHSNIIITTNQPVASMHLEDTEEPNGRKKVLDAVNHCINEKESLTMMMTEGDQSVDCFPAPTTASEMTVNVRPHRIFESAALSYMRSIGGEMSSSSSSNDDGNGVSKASAKSYDVVLFEKALLDSYGRFLMNLPRNLINDLVHLYFEIEAAFWWYDDFWFDQYSTTLPKLNLKTFGQIMCSSCPVLSYSISPGHRLNLMNNWRDYCRTIPLRGCIILNVDLSKVVVVRGWKSTLWSFPKGKIDENEDDAACAAREVYEEIGIKVLAHIDRSMFIEKRFGHTNIRMYLIPGISEDIMFQPTTRKEIGAVKWLSLQSLGINERKSLESTLVDENEREFDDSRNKRLATSLGQGALLNIFVKPLRRWISCMVPVQNAKKGAVKKGIKPFSKRSETMASALEECVPQVQRFALSPTVSKVDLMYLQRPDVAKSSKLTPVSGPQAVIKQQPPQSGGNTTEVPLNEEMTKTNTNNDTVKHAVTSEMYVGESHSEVNNGMGDGSPRNVEAEGSCYMPQKSLLSALRALGMKVGVDEDNVAKDNHHQHNSPTSKSDSPLNHNINRITNSVRQQQQQSGNMSVVAPTSRGNNNDNEIMVFEQIDSSSGVDETESVEWSDTPAECVSSKSGSAMAPKVAYLFSQAAAVVRHQGNGLRESANNSTIRTSTTSGGNGVDWLFEAAAKFEARKKLTSNNKQASLSSSCGRKGVAPSGQVMPHSGGISQRNQQQRHHLRTSRIDSHNTETFGRSFVKSGGWSATEMLSIAEARGNQPADPYSIDLYNIPLGRQSVSK